MGQIANWLGWALAGPALLGSFYALLAVFLVGRFMRDRHTAPPR